MALDWTVETLRVSLFSNAPIKIDHADWEQIAGDQQPEAEQKVLGRHSIAGPFLKGQLNIISGVGRVDCILRPKEQPTGDLPSVGPWREVLDEYIKRTEQWIASATFPVVRMAVGCVLHAPQNDLGTAYKSLLGLLQSVNVDPNRARDILFRVNWPMSSHAVPGLTLNRLTTWSIIQVQTQVQGVTPDRPGVVEGSPPSYFVRLEIDHNTDAKWSDRFEQSRLVSLYKELTTLAVDSAEKGELS